jgi:hypothetical protein
VEQPFPDSMDSGAWPFLAGGLPCQVGSGNERDLYSLIRMRIFDFVS